MKKLLALVLVLALLLSGRACIPEERYPDPIPPKDSAETENVNSDDNAVERPDPWPPEFEPEPEPDSTETDVSDDPSDKPESDSTETDVSDDPSDEPESDSTETDVPDSPSDEPESDSVGTGVPDGPPDEPEPEHSPLYIPGLSVENVITYFNEVCLDAEFSTGGDPSRLQKWMVPITYAINGTATDEDLAVLEGFAAWLNTMEGFPGMKAAEGDDPVNLQIHFCTPEEMQSLLGDHFVNMDGAVTFWYINDEIYDATICYLTRLDQTLRNSVILEEIYNGLGPVQDTDLREDSIIFSGFSQPQSLTAVDELLLKLLYHPDMLCGMDAAACEAVIRSLYY